MLKDSEKKSLNHKLLRKSLSTAVNNYEVIMMSMMPKAYIHTSEMETHTIT